MQRNPRRSKRPHGRLDGASIARNQLSADRIPIFKWVQVADHKRKHQGIHREMDAVSTILFRARSGVNAKGCGQARKPCQKKPFEKMLFLGIGCPGFCGICFWPAHAAAGQWLARVVLAGQITAACLSRAKPRWARWSTAHRAASFLPPG